MSKKTGGWNGYDPCESGGEAGKKWGVGLEVKENLEKVSLGAFVV